ncbi:MAG: transcriptional repressor [Enterobacterales bacterium]|nr:transcriptional repressor [Enterobacterales bacterium]
MAHNHQHCIDTAITAAERICREQGLRFTESRKRVLKIIWDNHEAIKAYDILERLQKIDRSAKPPTAYRALDFLLENGFIHRIESLNSYIGCPNPDHTHHFQLLICEKCGLVKEMDVPDLAEQLKSAAEKHNFTMHQQVIEVHGLCQECQSN